MASASERTLRPGAGRGSKQSAPTIVKSQSLSSLKASHSVDIRRRVLAAVDRYPGLKSAEEYVAAKAGAAREKDRQAEKEYWGNLKKFKDEVKSVFKLPSDSYAGKRSVQEEIMEKVEAGQRKLAETDMNYQLWLQEMQRKAEEKKQEKIQQRKTDIEELQQRKIEIQAQLQKDLEQKSAGFKEKEKAYWNWLAEAKQAVAARPGVAPLQKFEGKSVEELVAEKKAALNKEVTAREQEYKVWLESVSKPKFKLPSQAVNTPAQRQMIIAESAKRGLEKLNATTSEYQKWVKEMEQLKNEAMMEKVKNKLQADREDDKRRENAMNALQEKMAFQKAEEDRKAKESKEEVFRMYHKVHCKPLLIEQAYDYGRIFKQAHALGSAQ
mmetsp:Transcript_57420/g.134432  ORF Transcript_57420/g.134432 Transcript_57420/m.134432 type:complete len:382 (-) Transcript_57420:74-1219(-)